MGEEWRTGKTKVKLAAIDRSWVEHRPEWNKANAFIKLEAGNKIPTKARLIQGNKNERTAYEFPEEYAAVSNALKHVGDEEFMDNGVTYKFIYAGGLDHNAMSDQLSLAWGEAGLWKILDECDGSNWDATMQEPTLTAEYNVYNMLKMRAAVAFRSRCGGVDGRILVKIDRITKYALKYHTAWKRLSGDWNTSVGNTLVSMIVRFVVLSELPPSMRPTKVWALFMGDDYLAIYSFDKAVDFKQLKLLLDQGEQGMGITPERGLFKDPIHTTFISMGVWPRRGGGYQFLPQPGRQLGKLFWTLKNVHPNNTKAHCRGIAEAFWPVYWGFPMMMRFLQRHFYLGVQAIAYESYFSDKFTKRIRDVDFAAGFVARYNLPFTATEFEWPKDGGGMVLLRHPLVDEMIRVESLAPADRPACIS